MSDDKIQITILILRRGALSTHNTQNVETWKCRRWIHPFWSISIVAIAGRLPAWRHLQRHWQAIFDQFHSGRYDFILNTFNTFVVLDIWTLCQYNLYQFHDGAHHRLGGWPLLHRVRPQPSSQFLRRQGRRRWQTRAQADFGTNTGLAAIANFNTYCSIKRWTLSSAATVRQELWPGSISIFLQVRSQPELDVNQLETWNYQLDVDQLETTNISSLSIEELALLTLGSFLDIVFTFF